MGSLVGIYVAERAGAPMSAVEEAEFVEGRGIVGDRYYGGTGRWSPEVAQPKNEVTLVDAGEVVRFNAAHHRTLRPEDLRRNLVTRDVDLNALVGVEFRVGPVVLRGIKLCEPCEYLAGLTCPETLPGLTHRAGLRAAIVHGGVVNTRQPVAIHRSA